MNPKLTRASVQLSFEPSVGVVTPLAAWVAQLCELALQDQDASSRLQMAVYELVENSVRYCKPDSPVGVEVELVRHAETSELKVSTRNRATPEQLQRAVEHLASVKGATDAVSYYDDLVRDSAPRAGVSGLGLARLRAEADLNVDYHVIGDELTICVHAALDPHSLHD